MKVIPLKSQDKCAFLYIGGFWKSMCRLTGIDAIEILYLQEGELKVNTESTSRNLRSGQCTLIQPNKVHSTLCTRPNKAIVFQIPLLFLEKICSRCLPADFSA